VREVEIPYEGETVRAHELEFTTEADNWGEYKTEEGVHIKMRSVVARIYRLIDQTRDDGRPVHLLHGSVVIDVAVPDAQATLQTAGES
jgi:hypothetical protein